MKVGGDAHKTAIKSRCRGRIGSHGEASNATESRAPCNKVGALQLAQHPGLGHSVFISPHSLAFCICTLAVSYHSFILFCPSLLRSAVFFSFLTFHAWLLHLARVFFQNTHKVLLPRLARFNWPQPLITPPTHTANVFCSATGPKHFFDCPTVSSSTSHTHSLPTSINILAGRIQYIQLDATRTPASNP